MLTATKVPAYSIKNSVLLTERAFNPIIIVDDSRDDRDLMFRTLQSFLPPTQSVVLLKSGRELFDYLDVLEYCDIQAEAFEQEVPKMIFLDLLMPDMDGVDVLKALRHRHIWDDVPVTLITGSCDDEYIRRAGECGANAFIPKPFSKIDLMQAIQKAGDYSSTLI